MAILLFDITSKSQRTTKELTRELLWYDHVNGVMKKFTGGQLDYKYNFDTKELEVKAVPLLYVGYEKQSNRTAIMEWYDNNKDNFGLELLDGGMNEKVAVNVPDKYKSDIEDMLSESPFEYEIV